VINTFSNFEKRYYIFTVLNYCILIFYFCYPIFKYNESPFLQSSSNDFIYSSPLSEFAILPGKINEFPKNNGNETNVDNLKYVHIFLNDLGFKSQLKIFKFEILKSNYDKLNYISYQIISRAPPSKFKSILFS